MVKCILFGVLALMSTPSFSDVEAGKDIPPDFSVLEQHGFILPEDTKRKIIESGIFDTPYNGQVYQFKIEEIKYTDAYGSAKCYIKDRQYKGSPYSFENIRILEGKFAPPFAILLNVTEKDTYCHQERWGVTESVSLRQGAEVKISDIKIARFERQEDKFYKAYLLDEFEYEKFSGNPGGFKFRFSGEQFIGKDLRVMHEFICSGISGISKRIGTEKNGKVSGTCHNRFMREGDDVRVDSWDVSLPAPYLFFYGDYLIPAKNFEVNQNKTERVNISPIQYDHPGAPKLLGGYVDISITREK